MMASTIVGFVGVAGLILLALREESPWLGALSVFILLYCWQGLKSALALYRLAKIPRREGFACPSCKSAPPIGNYWRCSNCKNPFDAFAAQAVCPSCAKAFPKRDAWTADASIPSASGCLPHPLCPQS